MQVIPGFKVLEQPFTFYENKVGFISVTCENTVTPFKKTRAKFDIFPKQGIFILSDEKSETLIRQATVVDRATSSCQAYSTVAQAHPQRAGQQRMAFHPCVPGAEITGVHPHTQDCHFSKDVFV